MSWTSRGSIRCSALALVLCCSAEKPPANEADAGAPRLSEAEWRAATAPRTGPHEIWTAACNGSRVGQEYLVVPLVNCSATYDANHAVSSTRHCVAEDDCQSSADCTAKPGGICKGSPTSECLYPGSDEGEACERDAECTFLAGGQCRPRIGGGESLCNPTGACEEVPFSSCAYPYMPQCHADADCAAAPGGTCRFSVHSECVYNECQTDSECGPLARCDCQDVRRCVPAQCFSADDCGGLACEASRAVHCGNIYPPAGYYCHSEQDECQSDDDCRSDCAQNGTRRPCAASCVYDPAASHWACRAIDCATP